MLRGGSLFAILQRLSTTGAFNTIGAAMIAGGVVLGGIGSQLPVSGAGSYRVGGHRGRCFRVFD